jgi:hypothetical protein
MKRSLLLAETSETLTLVRTIYDSALNVSKKVHHSSVCPSKPAVAYRKRQLDPPTTSQRGQAADRNSLSYVRISRA